MVMIEPQLSHSMREERLLRISSATASNILERFSFPVGRRDTQASRLLQGMIDALPAGVAIVDTTGHIVGVNRAWQSLTSSSRPGVGDDYNAIEIFIGKRGQNFAHELQQVCSGDLSETSRKFTIRVDTKLRHCEMRALPLRQSRENYVILVNEDVSILYALRRGTLMLLDQLAKSEERERQRIAREMHDSTLQDLIGIALNLRRLDHLTGDPLVAEVFGEIREIVKRAQQDVRTMSYLLHPPLLDSRGLTIALGALVQGLSQRTNIRIDFECELDSERFPADTEMALYRVAQEALINVHRHACATNVVVRYRRQGPRLIIEVEDDGIGFDNVDGHAVSLGVGINGMRARLRQLGGLLEISRLQPGTRLKATFPISVENPALEAPGHILPENTSLSSPNGQTR